MFPITSATFVRISLQQKILCGTF